MFQNSSLVRSEPKFELGYWHFPEKEDSGPMHELLPVRSPRRESAAWHSDAFHCAGNIPVLVVPIPQPRRTQSTRG